MGNRIVISEYDRLLAKYRKVLPLLSLPENPSVPLMAIPQRAETPKLPPIPQLRPPIVSPPVLPTPPQPEIPQLPPIPPPPSIPMGLDQLSAAAQTGIEPIKTTPEGRQLAGQEQQRQANIKKYGVAEPPGDTLSPSPPQGIIGKTYDYLVEPVREETGGGVSPQFVQDVRQKIGQAGEAAVGAFTVPQAIVAKIPEEWIKEEIALGRDPSMLALKTEQILRHVLPARGKLPQATPTSVDSVWKAYPNINPELGAGLATLVDLGMAIDMFPYIGAMGLRGVKGAIEMYKKGIPVIKGTLPKLRTIASEAELKLRGALKTGTSEGGQIIATKGMIDRLKSIGIKPSTIDEATIIQKNYPGIIKESGRGLDQAVVTLKEEGFISKAIDDKTAMDELTDILKNKEARVKEPDWDAMTTEEFAKAGAIPDLKAPEMPKLAIPEGKPPIPEVKPITFPKDINERIIAGQDLRDMAKEQNYKIAVNPDGSVSMWHGTSKEKANNILTTGKLETQSFLSPNKKGSEYYAEGKAIGGESIQVKVDARDIQYSTGTGEVFAPDGLVRDTDGIWKSPKRIKPPATIAPKASEMPIKAIETPKPGITTPETGIGQIPPQKPPAPPMPPAGVNPEDEFYNLLKQGKLNEAEAQLPKIKHLDRATATEYLEEAKIRALESEKYIEQFPKYTEPATKPTMTSYEDLYPSKYEVDIGQEIATKKHTALRDKTLSLIESKDLSNDTMARIRKGLNIGSVKKASTEQLEELHTFVSRLEKGDKFLSPKQSEALSEILKDIERPELTPKRIIIDKFGDKEEVLNKGIFVKRIPNQLIPTVDIKEGHPLIERIVNKGDDLLWQAEKETERRLSKFDEMLSAAEKSRPERGIKEKMLKTNPEIFDALSGKQVSLTREERGVVAYLRNFFTKAREDLELTKWRKNYVTHIEQGLEEKIWNQGILKTVSEMVGRSPKDPNIPTNIMLALDDIIGGEKFFKFAQKRTGGITPTQNIRKIIEEYSTVYERVMALNKVLPEGQAIQQLLLQPKTAKWMQRYLQNLKGRALDFEFRTGKAAWLANIGDKIVDIGYVKLLGLKRMSALKNVIAGEGNSIILTPVHKYLVGKGRFMSSPKKAMAMAKEYGILDDMFYEYATTGFKGGLRKLERYSMVGQQLGEIEVRTSMMLSGLTKEEWVTGVISMGKRRQILDAIAQTQGIFSKTQTPLLLQTAPGRMITQMNRWRITNGLIVRRVANSAITDMKAGRVFSQNVRNFGKMFLLYGSGMYLSYELGKAGYKKSAKVAQAMAETVNNMVELVTTDTLLKMFQDNPSFSVLSEVAYTIQEAASYIGVPGVKEPRKVTYRRGIEDTYIAPYEEAMELIGAIDGVQTSTELGKTSDYDTLKKQYGGGNGGKSSDSDYAKLLKEYGKE